MPKYINVPGSAKDVSLQDRFNQDVAQAIAEQERAVTAMKALIVSLELRLTNGGL